MQEEEGVPLRGRPELLEAISHLPIQNSRHGVCHTGRDVLHQDRALGGQSQAVGAEAGVPLDLDGEAERVVPLI